MPAPVLSNAEIVQAIRNILENDIRGVELDHSGVLGIDEDCIAVMFGKWRFVFDADTECLTLQSVMSPDGRYAKEFRDSPLDALDPSATAELGLLLVMATLDN
jgi:hypothetical protein